MAVIFKRSSFSNEVRELSVNSDSSAEVLSAGKVVANTQKTINAAAMTANSEVFFAVNVLIFAPEIFHFEVCVQAPYFGINWVCLQIEYNFKIGCLGLLFFHKKRFPADLTAG